MSRIKIVSASAVPQGKGIVVEADGKEYAVFKREDSFHVLQNFCPHRGGPLGHGTLSGETVTCPLHGWEFNVISGVCLTRPGVRIASYPVFVENGEVVIEVPGEG